MKQSFKGKGFPLLSCVFCVQILLFCAVMCARQRGEPCSHTKPCQKGLRCRYLGGARNRTGVCAGERVLLAASRSGLARLDVLLWSQIKSLAWGTGLGSIFSLLWCLGRRISEFLLGSAQGKIDGLFYGAVWRVVWNWGKAQVRFEDCFRFRLWLGV